MENSFQNFPVRKFVISYKNSEVEIFSILIMKQRYYGPYSGKVKYVINVLNGSYVMGYSDMNKKPFDNISLVADGYPDVKSMIDNDKELGEIAEKDLSFLMVLF